MGLKRRLVIANSDPYTDGTVRPPEELEAAVKRRREVPLTLGHPPRDSRGIPEHLLLGKVEYSYDKSGKRQIGDVTFFDEYWERLPKELQDRVVNMESVPISPGFNFDGADQQTIRKIVPDHLAVLIDGGPLCPLDTCGVNVRMESGSDYRYEQKTESTEDDMKIPKPVEKTETQELRDDIRELRELFIESMKPKEEPVVVEHEVKAGPPVLQAEIPPQKEPEPVRASAPEPVRETPASVPVSDDFERDPVTGGIVFSGKHDRSKKK